MAIDPAVRPYPVIDVDPHFKRVVSYFRSSDYATWAGLTAMGPAIMYWMETYMPTKLGASQIRSAMRTCGGAGLVGGFLYSYCMSSYRFMGFKENAREVQMDLVEMRARAASGEPLYGKSLVPDDVQKIAAANSRNSQLVMSFIPMFNLVNHNFHGVDTSKYFDQSDKDTKTE
ncbi:hypothetical protein H4R34_002393 [Dimargaris verticillata]|uniref:NADH-ubiquinone oxidoreductase 21 kDa subunit n=1 Tax=Dimargaris verticillata TaxID=2761393 RepID=A0A9W8B8W9_9FUNG|nr:hypothetical protein H4R34_002393 [Dimargaris verticillata]